jgi:hypothetical protein
MWHTTVGFSQRSDDIFAISFACSSTRNIGKAVAV